MQSRLSFPRPSAPAGLVFCLWFHLWKRPRCEAATKETEPTCRHSFVESHRAGAKGVCTRVSPHPHISSVARVGAVRGVRLRRRVIAQYTHCLFWFYGLARSFAQTRACNLKGIPIFRVSIRPPPWYRRDSFSQSCVSFHSHTHTHPAHTQNTHLFGLCTSVAFPLLFIKPTYG